MPSDGIIVSEAALNDILVYLTHRPWREVAHLIDNIRKDARPQETPDVGTEERGEE